MIQFVTDTIENPLVAVEQIFNSAYLWSEDKKLPHELFRIEEDLVLQIGEAIIKNIPTIRDIINRTNFWDFSFFDLVLFFMSVLAVTAVLTATICRHFYKSKHHSSRNSKSTQCRGNVRGKTGPSGERTSKGNKNYSTFYWKMHSSPSPQYRYSHYNESFSFKPDTKKKGKCHKN